ncbi:MAG: AAHS family 4-hydroxybenzoate transporter-like MFS transporter [Arenicella sp.]|jgi:AAHS family 4-hydroxybenzoate transporter-like MFS transporter
MTKAESTEQLISRIIDNGQVSFQQVLVIFLCLMFNMLDGFDITAMAVVAKTVGQELSLSADKLGFIFSFALAGMMIGAMLLAPLSDIIGRRNMIIASLLLVSVSILFTARADSLFEFIVLRFFSGLGAGAMLACQATLASEYSPDKYRALSVGIVTAGYPMGAMMTSVIAGYVMPDYGWRGMFWFGGGVTLIMTIVALMLIPESLKFLFNRRPTKALQRANRILKKLKKDTLTALPEIHAAEIQHSGLIGNMRNLLHPSIRSTTLILWAAFFMCFATLYVLMSWIPRLVEDAGHGFQVGRDAFFWFNFGGVVGILTMGVLSTRYVLSNVISLMAFGAAICMVVFASIDLTLTLMMGLIFLIGVLQQGGFTGLYAAASKAYPTVIRTTGIGWAIGLGRSGAVIGPIIAGYLIAADFNMSSIFYLFAVPMIVGSFMAYTLKIK